MGRFRLFRRARLWWVLLHRIRPLSRTGWVRLSTSALADSIGYALGLPGSVSPRSLFRETVFSPQEGVCFTVRGGTDDLYNVFPAGEGDAHEALLKPLGPGDAFVDVGANIGYYTVLAAKKVAPGGFVIAVEAMPQTAAQLRTNVALNRVTNVEIVEGAAHTESGERLKARMPRRTFGMASVVAVDFSEDAMEQIEVATITLDDICGRLGRIKMIKMDIEGAEYAALLGARQTLRRTERLVIECNQHREQIEALLRESGFSVSRLDFANYIGALNEKFVTPATAD